MGTLIVPVSPCFRENVVVSFIHSYIYFPSLKNIQSNDTNMMEEVQLKAKPEYVAPPFTKLAK